MKCIALFLTLILTVSCCPLWAAAEEGEPAPAAASEAAQPEAGSLSDALLAEGTKTVTLERNQVRSCYTFTAETAGDYTFRIDGPDGEFTYRDEGWIDRQFTSDGVSVTAPLAARDGVFYGHVFVAE